MSSSPQKKSSREPRRKGFSKRMKKYSGTYIAGSFLDFYKERGHTICQSSPLVPEDPDTPDPERKPSSATTRAYCRALAGWVEGEGTTIRMDLRLATGLKV